MTATELGLFSPWGLWLQLASSLLAMILLFSLTRSIHLLFLNYWTIAWAFAVLSKVSLLVQPPEVNDNVGWFSLDLISCTLDYAHALMVIAGCRHLVRNQALRQWEVNVYTPILLLCLVLVTFGGNTATLYLSQSVVLSVLWLIAAAILWDCPLEVQLEPGFRLLLTMLALAAILDFYLVFYSVYAAQFEFSQSMQPMYGRGFYVAVIEILVGFGMVMMAMEGVRRDLENANRHLLAMTRRLEMMAETDPLTQVLNRHAFARYLEKHEEQGGGEFAGTVAVADLDNLKQLNDLHHHEAGDAALQIVARAMGSLLIGEERVFRWGGDEFLLLFPGQSKAVAEERLRQLPSLLEKIGLPHVEQPVTLHVSIGLAEFANAGELKAAIDLADDRMYQEKMGHRASLAERNETAPSGRAAARAQPMTQS